METDKFKIIHAVNHAALQMPPLTKEDHNPHGNYNYVSIDEYFDFIAKVAFNYGLAWSVRQTDLSLSNEPAPMKPFMIGTFEFDLLHIEGGVWPCFFRCTVTHPVQGAQTAGSMLSYAMKMFLRMTFGVVTGEQDADATDPAAHVSAPSLVFDPLNMVTRHKESPAPIIEMELPEPVESNYLPPKIEPRGPEGLRADTIFNLAVEFLADCPHEAGLEDYWRDNISTFELVKAESPTLHKKLIKAFKDRREALKTGETV